MSKQPRPGTLAVNAFIQDQLAQRSMSQLELAAAAGIPDATLSRHLNGQVDEWKMSYLVDIARALEIDPWTLFSVAGAPARKPNDPRGEEAYLADLVAAFPWLRAALPDLTTLTADQREVVFGLIETLRRRQGGSQ